MAVSTRQVTYEEWLRMPLASDVREEVVRGEVRRMPPNKWHHTEIVENIAEALRSQLNRKDARVVVAEFGLVIRRSPLTSRVPDLAVFLRGTVRIEDGYVHSAPALVVEVWSPGNSPEEMEDKRRDYESIGVADYWIVLPHSRSIEVFRSDGGSLVRERTVDSGLLIPLRFPSVTLRVADIWSE